MGPHPEWQRHDEEFVHITKKIFHFSVKDFYDKLSLGGLGLQLAAGHALAACASGLIEAAKVRHISKEGCLDAPQEEPLWKKVFGALEAKAIPKLSELLTSAIKETEHQPRLQKAIDKFLAPAPAAPTDPRAALLAAATKGKFASTWLTGHTIWLDSAQFRVLIRRRYGQPISSVAVSCPLCGDTADEFGDHILGCMKGGVRNLLHNNTRNAIHAVASQAMLNPAKEYQLNGVGDGRRVDVALRETDAVTCLDFALHNPHITSAYATAGAAAKRYEAQKYRTYSDALPPRHVLVPMVIETTMAWSPTAIPMLERICQAHADRFETGLPGFFTALARILRPIAAGIADILLAQMATECE